MEDTLRFYISHNSSLRVIHVIDFGSSGTWKARGVFTYSITEAQYMHSINVKTPGALPNYLLLTGDKEKIDIAHDSYIKKLGNNISDYICRLYLQGLSAQLPSVRCFKTMPRSALESTCQLGRIPKNSQPSPRRNTFLSAVASATPG